MGWPRKNDGMRLYRDKDRKTYFLVEIHEEGPRYSAVANVLTGDSPSLGSCTIPPGYIAENFLKRVQWSELPEVWQRAFLPWIVNEDDPESLRPETIRGFWRVGQQPRKKAVTS